MLLQENFIRETNSMETEEDILATYINLIDMVDVFTNLQMDFILSIQNYCKKKRYTKYFLLQANGKYKVLKSKPTPNLLIYVHTYICIN